MNAAYYVNWVTNQYHTNNVRELIDYCNISIQYCDTLNKECDSSLFVLNKQAYITLKTDLNPLYENFLLAHELGHYIIHYDDHMSFSFLMKTRKNALEREANEFACRLLLKDINIKEVENIEFIVQEKGIPLQIWYTVHEFIFPLQNNSY
ncbi:ImmA/IrrE family metallo-endopeptidase [Candidatus Stoquefichus massiliensis]|uniref:ImmA/IrrE family metallo-endopeptidase n=1 Tax=Candidatus Stoquefichus massiliensis TaxID=1470350 RepID=UPI00048A0ACF|nr:ImmA/IrrE family metallo-endopeptidase [Candidatus Stoquefichus massiliensis]